MKALRWTAVVLAALLVVIGAALTWLLRSESGARWVVARAEQALGGKLAVAQVNGTLAGPLTLVNLRYVDHEANRDIRVGRATVDVALRELLTRTVHVRHAAAEDMTVLLGTPKEPPPERPPPSLDPPIDVIVDIFSLTRARIERNEQRLAAVKEATLAGSWTDDGIRVRSLEVEAEEGAVEFRGEVDERAGEYVGNAAGNFRWRYGERTFAGELTVDSDVDVATLDLRLTSPVEGRLEASLQQAPGWPWQFELEVPRFDPRERLLPGSALASLEASLRGRGDRHEAQLSGAVLVNGERLRIDPLRAAFTRGQVEIKELRVRSVEHPVSVQAVGSVRYGEQPLALDLTLRWPHSVLPPEWVGQPLASRGTLVLKGNPSAFDARGTLAVGPPDRLANVAFAMRGSSQALAIEQLTIIQESGRLVAHGEVELRPVLTWQLEADATRFDPGEFLVAWPGDVDFALTTSGRLTQKGPRAELQLSRFAGTLRHRAVSGQANLALAPNQVVSGTLQVASGRSSIRVRGRPGEELDLSVIAQVASLDDWVPNARGALNGRFDVTGRWPDVQLAGSARGTALAFGDSRARIVRANVDLESVAERRGLITLNAREVLAGGFEFAEVGIHTEGDPGDHVVRFRARGTPVSAELSARGGQTDGGWTGTIERLAIAALDVPRLALREPVKVVANAEQFSVSESCLSGENVSFCVAASGNPQGRMQGRYSIENLPLALVRAVTAPELPLGVGGTLQGRGQITRNTDGTLIGRAQLVSDSGYIGYEEIVEEPLLTYENLRLDAQLAGTEAHATLSGALSDGGSIEAEATASELLHPSPALSGRARVSLGTLRAIEIFTPQLAAVQGRGEARASFSGRPGSLGLAGAIEVHDFAAEVPALGLKLREGAFEASLEPAGGARFAGQITSAEGQVTIEGTASPTGTINAQIKGNQVLVADIPAGRIVVDPALTLTRTPEQVSLVGTIELPDATIDLTKLPQGRAGQRASPDVVVIDEPPEEKEQDEFPLYTNVTIVIGPEVELAGFGLEAIVAGRLVVREKPGEEPVASGEVNLEGTYKAYGQDLTIERGRLLYAGTTLGNPQLDIIAVRELPDVTAQLRVTGTAQQPQLAVSSDPAMSQTEALSYLVRGKPVNQLTSEDNDVMQTAARSLGGAAGNLLAKSLGRRLGIDEIGIEQSTELGGSVFTIGEYLSPRLYLSYGWGLFEPGEIVTLRYEISDEWALQASQGPEEQRAGIEYRIER